MLNLHRDKIIVRREPGRDRKIYSDHRQDGNDEVHRLYVRFKIYMYTLKFPYYVEYSNTLKFPVLFTGHIYRTYYKP